MKILLTGASGFFGKKAATILARKHQVIGTHHSLKKEREHCYYLDVTSQKDVEDFYERFKPDVVVHAAALVNVALCEKNRTEAWNVNVNGVKNFVDLCGKDGIKMLYVSTDYVFDGTRDNYTEEDDPNPVNYYGVTKLEGEKLVQELDNYAIIRPTILQGYNDDDDKPTFPAQVIRALEKGESVDADNKTLKYPLLIDDLALAVQTLIEGGGRIGVFHAGSDKSVTRYQWALEVARVFGLPKQGIKPVVGKDSDYKKPHNAKLDASKLKRLGAGFVDVTRGLEIMRRQMGCGFKAIYSARPDKMTLGKNASLMRIALGRKLGEKKPAEADIVVPVPESGIFAATGYADAAKIPLYFGLIRDYATNQMLYETHDSERHSGIRRKLIVVPEIVQGKRVVLVDEAIISGATLKIVTEKLRNAGAKEIHLRIPAPPMLSPCQARMQPHRTNLAAPMCSSTDKQVVEKELAVYFGVQSAAFLSLEDFENVLGKTRYRCVECFTTK